MQGCTDEVSNEAGSIEEKDNGVGIMRLKQACSGAYNVEVQYALSDGGFRKDIIITPSTGTNIDVEDVEVSLFTSPSNCDGHLYIPFVDQAPKTGFESAQDRIVPVSDTGVNADFQASYLTVPDSIGGLTGQGARCC